MRLKNILLVVSDIEKSVKFYTELFGLRVITDFGDNVILSEGLVLQQKKLWEEHVGKTVIFGNHASELYFIENDLESFEMKLKCCVQEADVLHGRTMNERGQNVIRIYDPDRHMIEISESSEAAARRCLKEGLSPQETAERTRLSLHLIEEMVGNEES